MKRNWNKILLTVIIVAVVLIAIIGGLTGFITDYLWFKDLSYTSVFWKKLLTQLEIGVPVFIILTALGYVYLHSIRKSYYKRANPETVTVKVKTLNLAACALSVITSLIVTVLAVQRIWFELLKFTNSTGFSSADPIFNLNISFYVFKLQFIKELNSIVIMAIVAFVILTLVYYFFLMNVAKPSESDDDRDAERGSGFQGAPSGDILTKIVEMIGKFMGAGGIGGAQPQSAPAPKPRTSINGNSTLTELLHIATKQITALGIIFFLMVGISYFLKQYDLLYSHTDVLTGAGYTDINLTIWVYRIIVVLSVVAAVMFAIGVHQKKYKTMLTIPVVMIAVGILGAGAGYLIQSLVVSPDQIGKESKYLEYNIAYTQEAYGLRDVSIKPFAADESLTSEDIIANSDTIRNIRINDYEPAQTFYNSTQSIRQYYKFNNVNVDRYMVNGEYTQTFLSAREIDESQIPQQWINLHLKYTHGYGVTLSRVDKITPSGQPDMLIRDIPPVSQIEEIQITRPEIYFGELANDYILTNTDEKEFDYPQGDNNVSTIYEGETGIKMTPFNRFMFAIREGSMKLLVSSNINSESKIIINRNVTDRVQKIMPYLQYSDPYMVTVDGKLYWIVDAYTVSSMYPYSEPYEYELATGNTTNYIRNSVKVVIDAYSGDTNYYLVDENDPIANSMKNIYPALFKAPSEMPEGIRAHIRYPSFMLDIQANIYKKYHVNDVTVFFQGEDRWAIANEKLGASDTEIEMTPNYYIMKLPGEDSVEFINSVPYTPREKNNMTALLIARNDGEHYGELILYQLPKGKLIMGPSQIDAQIAQDTVISRDFSLWENSGSTYSRGNMFVIPIEDSIMYVEPIYLKASNSSLPEVKRVIIYYGDKIAYEATLSEALDSMFGSGTGALATGGSSSETPDKPSTDKPSGSGDSQQQSADELIQSAVNAYNAAIEAQKNGDWTKYGSELKKLEGYLNALNPVEEDVDAEAGTDTESSTEAEQQ